MIQTLFNIKYPIIQGAMANIATASFAATVSNAGGLGCIATGAMKPEEVAQAISECRKLTNKPFAVNVMLMNPYSAQIVDVICQQKVAIVTTGAGNPGPYIKKLKESGCMVVPVVSSVALAKRMMRYDIDAIIAEGTEAGGHVGEITTMALIPQVVAAVSVPVIAAGGIANGKGMLAALALGAKGIQIGTCLLVADECPIHDAYKDAVIQAKDSSTVVTGRSVNAPVRVMKNQMSQTYLKKEASGSSKEDLEKLTLGGLKKAVFQGDVKNGSVMMGQIAGLCTEKKSIQKILDSIIIESIQQLHTCFDYLQVVEINK